ncbi:Beta-galactosidase trimerisation domain-containing protein [Faunimonas pinastri]|uniref:Beta-galactosidase trimerisation domain-containing protein n=1 Tax=Faunimonas pinastri TaxID=1855383 RepID=A0A1H9H0B3_9HYPH|nr:alpha-amylase family protein [Faunimonas pinastri]SEQ55812.1 Beta-galactosidase trimerisation domain-containing protein [Faunimonas pinastri]
MSISHGVLRQIHLDFHTSKDIPKVGESFNPETFARTLQEADVNSIILFARCHHGYLYYPGDESILGPVHPGLDFDLLGQQLAACRKLGIKVSIYTTVQWDVLTASRHPEWRVMHDDGSLEGTPPFEAGFYRKLSLSSPYQEVFKDHLKDILKHFQPDGIYFDFIRPDCDVSEYSQETMRAQGLDPAKREDQEAFGDWNANRYEMELAELARSIQPNLSVTFNGGHIGMRHRDAAPAYTHFELETLPSGGWGYMYFPVTGRYARTLGPGVVGTTGKFHSTWGDFHSLKNKAALEYEVFRMIAQGAGCSIGDQLHPNGALDPDTYELVGSVYKAVRAKEPWLANAKPLTEIAVYNPEEQLGGGVMDLPKGIQGMVRMLVEGGHQFDLVGSWHDLDAYRLVVLPDYIRLTDEQASRLRTFIANGGKVIASFESGLSQDGSEFILTELGVRLDSDGPRDLAGKLVRGKVFERHDYAQYVKPREALSKDMKPAERPIYIRGTDVSAQPGSTVLADLVEPYFDRTYQHYISHLQAPSTGHVGKPAVVQNGSVIYFNSPIATQYEQCAPLWVRQLFLNAVDILLPDPLVRHEGPSTLEVSILRQAEENRDVVHLLHYVPERRGAEFDTIEDVLPVFGVKLSIRSDHPVETITLEPQRVQLPFEERDGRIEVNVLKVHGHQMLSLKHKQEGR